jgi:hypothetical protein
MFYAPFELLEADYILGWAGYPSSRDGMDAIFRSASKADRAIIRGCPRVSRMPPRYSHVSIVMGGCRVAPVPCFVLEHTSAVDLACGVRRLLRRLGVSRDVCVRELCLYDSHARGSVTLINTRRDTHERAYDSRVGSEDNADVLTCLILDLDVSWWGLMKHRLSTRRATDSALGIIAASVAAFGS